MRALLFHLVCLTAACAPSRESVLAERDALLRDNERLARENEALRARRPSAGKPIARPTPAAELQSAKANLVTGADRTPTVPIGQISTGPWFRVAAIELRRCGDAGATTIHVGVEVVVDNLAPARISWGHWDVWRGAMAKSIELEDGSGNRHPSNVYAFDVPRCPGARLPAAIPGNTRARGWLIFAVPDGATGMKLRVPLREPHHFAETEVVVDLDPGKAARGEIALPDPPETPKARSGAAPRTVKSAHYDVAVEGLRECFARPGAPSKMLAPDLSFLSRSGVTMAVGVQSLRDAEGREYGFAGHYRCEEGSFPGEIEPGSKGRGLSGVFEVPSKTRGLVARVAVVATGRDAGAPAEIVELALGDAP